MRNLNRPLRLALFMMWTTACSTPDPMEASGKESVETDHLSDGIDDAGDGVSESEAVTDTGDGAVDADRPGEPCGAGMVFDCALACVNEAALVHHVGDGVCDDLSPGFALSCEAYAFDNGDCADADADPPSEADTEAETETETETETESAYDGEGPGDPCGDGLVYDCEMSCISAPIATAYIGDGFCDDGAFGYDLDCTEFDNDGGDCEDVSPEVDDDEPAPEPDGDGPPEPGQSCGDGVIYDCDLLCVSQSTATSWVGDGACDDGRYGMDLVCEAFNYDDGDCDVDAGGSSSSDDCDDEFG